MTHEDQVRATVREVRNAMLAANPTDAPSRMAELARIESEQLAKAAHVISRSDRQQHIADVKRELQEVWS